MSRGGRIVTISRIRVVVSAIRIAALLAGGWLSPGTAPSFAGQGGGTALPDTAAFHPCVKPTLEVHRASGPIRIDGDLDDPGWADAARTRDFSENFPVSQGRPPVSTEAFMSYDSSNLYLAFVCEDRNPAS